MPGIGSANWYEILAFVLTLFAFFVWQLWTWLQVEAQRRAVKASGQNGPLKLNTTRAVRNERVYVGFLAGFAVISGVLMLAPDYIKAPYGGMIITATTIAMLIGLVWNSRQNKSDDSRMREYIVAGMRSPLTRTTGDGTGISSIEEGQS